MLSVASLSHLARRGMEAANYNTLDTPGEQYQIQISTWGIVLLALTALFFSLATYAVEYTFGLLIPALVTVESPSALLFEPLDTIDTDEPTKNATDAELLLVKQKPITSSFRTTIKHLHAKGGFRARFRGISVFIVYSLCFFFVSIVLRSFLPAGITSFIATIALANINMAWTHIVISDPSPKPWYRRLPSTRVFKKIAAPTAIYAVAQQLAVTLPILLGTIYGLNIDPMTGIKTPASRRHAIGGGISVFVLYLALKLCLVLPTRVALTRVQASLLEDDQETIVPFDRSFGGKVVPEIVGGTGVIGMLDAWKTFDWNARVRLVKTYVKVYAIQVALSLLFLGIATVELLIFVGKSDLKKIIAGPSDGGHPGL